MTPEQKGNIVNRRVLVTGSEGFIGRAVTEELRSRGDEVIGFDIANGKDQDITYSLNVAKKLGHTRDVIHLAGVLGTHELFGKVRDAVDINIHGTVNVISGLRNMPGVDRNLTIIDQPHIWNNPYETTRNAAVNLARAFSREFGFPLEIVRTYNAFGPHQAYGKGHPQKIVPTFATKAWLGEPLPIWGDGSQLVDLVWVGDLARDLADGAYRGEAGGHVTDSGTGVGISVNDLAEMVVEHVSSITGVRSTIYHMPMRRGEFRVPDSSYYAAEPRHPFRLDRLIQTIDWYRPKHL